MASKQDIIISNPSDSCQLLDELILLTIDSKSSEFTTFTENKRDKQLITETTLIITNGISDLEREISEDNHGFSIQARPNERILPVYGSYGQPKSFYRFNIDQQNDYSLEDLSKYCELTKLKDINDLLKANRHLYPIIIDACKILDDYFTNSDKKLFVMTDPESISGNQKLSLHVFTDLDPLEAIEILDSFDQDWWIDNADSTEDKLMINLDFYDI
ncbi:hypothetical protein HQ587_05955 [bacterium]|nr:hypothetical protein [bacterium]